MKKRGRRILCLMMAMLMILTSMPATAMAATEESASELGNSSNVEAFQEETADAAVSFEEEEQETVFASDDDVWWDRYFYISMMKGEEEIYQNDSDQAMTPMLAQKYGFTYGPDIDVEQGQYTLLDALVLTQIEMFDATPENIRDYLDLDEAGNVIKVSGVDTRNFTFIVNGVAAGEYGTSIYVNNYEIYDGDEIIFLTETTDESAPVLSDISVTERAMETVTLSFNSDEGETGYYVVQGVDEEAPAQIDKDSAKTFTIGVDENEVTLEGLTEEACAVYLVAEDLTGNLGEIIKVDVEACESTLGEITLNRSSVAMGIGQEMELEAATVPEDPYFERQITWESSDEQIVKVEDGTITAVAKGDATVTASVGEISASCEVSVWSAPTIETTLEDGIQLRASRKTFDVIARDSAGNKLASSVKLDGSSVAYNWDDDTKTSYTLNFKDKKNGEHTVLISVTDSIGQTVTQEYKIYYTKAEEGELIGYATFDIEAITINCGYIVEPIKVPIYEGENAAEALVRLIQENGYDYTNTGTVESGFYLSAIVGANASRPGSATKELNLENASMNEDLSDLSIEWREGTEGQLGEFDYARGSGWMYCLNNVFPNVGFADSYLSDGDVVRVQFTLAYGADIGGGHAMGGDDGVGKIRAVKDDLSTAIATVNSAQNKEMLLANEEIKAAYEKANEVMLDLPASQDTVDEACEALNEAMAGEQPTSMSLKEKDLTLENMTSKKLEVVYEPEDITVPIQVQWESSDENIVEVEADGTVTAKNAGKATVTARHGEWSDSCEITVPVVTMTGISLAEEEVTLTRAETKELEVLYAPENTTDARDVTWTVEDTGVAVVTNGEIMGVAPGTTTVTAAVGDFLASCQVTVRDIPITGIESGETKITLQPKKTKKLSYQVLPADTTEDKTPTVVSTNKNVVTATANASGVTLKGVADGEADVIVKIGAQSVSYHVTVQEINVTDFEFREIPQSLNVGKSKSVYLDFEPVSTPDNQNEVEWTSSDTNVVSISKAKNSYGTLKGVAPGKATITAKLGDISKSFEIEVVEIPLEGISLETDKLEAYVGEYTSVRVSFNPSDTTDDTKVTWESSDPSVLNVTSTSSYGSFTPKKKGTVTLTAKVGKFSDSCEVVVKEVPSVESISMNTPEMEIGVGKSQSLGVTASPSKSDYSSSKVSWSSSDSTIATVGNTGYVKGIKPGTVTITASYGRLTASAKVTVVEYPVEAVVFKDAVTEIKNIGTKKSLGLAVIPSNYTEALEVTAVSSDESIAVVSSTSKTGVSVEAKAAGTAKITATVTAPSGTYTAETEVVVNANYIETLAFEQGSYDVEKGDSLRMSSEIEYQPSGGDTKSITWSSDNEEVATVNSSGSVKAVDYGTATITATLKNNRKVSCKIVVSKPVTDLIISATKLGMLKGSSIELDTIDFQPEDADMSKFSWTSSDTDVLTVKNGIIKAVGVGTATIYGIAGDAIATCEIEVTLSEDEVAAIEVMGLIDQIGEVTLDKEEAIQAVREAYDKLTRTQKAFVTNDETLFEAEERLEELKNVMNEKTPLVSLEKAGDDALELTWEKVKGAEGYRVYRKTAGGYFKAIANVDADTASYKDSGLTLGDTYIYTVRALYTLGGKTQLGPYESAGLKAKLSVDKVEITKVQSWGYCNLKVSWNEVEGADGYRLYYKVDNSSWKYVTQVGAGTTSYTHTGVTTGKTYTYYIRAYQNVNGTKVFGAYSDGKTGKAVPKQVVINSVKKASATSLKINWGRVNGASGYRIYRVDAKTGKWDYVTQINSGSTTSYTEKGLKKNTTYQYRIRAYRTVNGEKVFGAYSSLAKGSTK